MKTISREETKQRIDSGQVAVIEALPEESFRQGHLPGAENAPVDVKFDERIQQLVPDKQRPVIVYCANTECPASKKAAQRMDQLGYVEVYDYVDGKADWKAAGLPTES